jgi:flagellar protein FlgJ
MTVVKNSLGVAAPFVQNDRPLTQATEPSEAVSKKRAEAEKVAQDFETMFVELMVKSMRQTAQREDLSNAEDVYQGMLDSEYSKGMAASRSFGIKEQVLNWLEQTDPQLRLNGEGTTPTPDSQSTSVDTQKLRNEAFALKAATQAYQLSSGPR